MLTKVLASFAEAVMPTPPRCRIRLKGMEQIRYGGPSDLGQEADGIKMGHSIVGAPFVKEKFHIRITRLMKERKTTIREAAKATGVAASTIQNWRSGSIPSGNYDALRRLSSKLGVSLSYLLTGEDDLPHTSPPTIGDVLNDEGGAEVRGIFEVTIKKMYPKEEEM